ncbi:MAG: hypothetical protein ACFFD4_05665 [Candidatus Odinarchaeota archaeon]
MKEKEVNKSCTDELAEIRQILLETKETLDGMKQVLEILYEVSVRILSVTEREDTIFAYSEKSREVNRNSLISNKSLPGFSVDTLNTGLNEINGEGSI